MRERFIELLFESELFNGADGKADASCLADFLLANGVIVPPCKVGDKVFFIGHVSDSIPDFIYDDTVTKIGVTTRGIMSEKGIDFSAFGKNVFLTREDAEQALKGEKE